MNWLESLTEWAEDNLQDSEREALWRRGVSDEQIRAFRIGTLRQKLPDVPKDFLTWSHRGTKLNDVFVFPLTNILGEIKGFQFRYIDRAKKGYMDYFASSGEPVLFGLGQAIPYLWKTKSVTLVEGVFDLFPVQRARPDTISILTAGVSESIVSLLRRFVDNVTVIFDKDKAGRFGASQFVRDYGQDFNNASDVDLPAVRKMTGELCKDPSDLWEVWGDDRLGVYLRQLENPFQI